MAATRKVLFLCIGNSCRSQMAEGFARAYGNDIMIPASAGLAPAMGIAPLTRQVMAEKNIDIEDHFPKGAEMLSNVDFDLIVNISGRKLPTKMAARVVDWKIEDPIGKKESVYKTVRDQIEGLVMKLILEMRTSKI